MFFDHAPPKRRFLVPEVVQTSAMDCGPAALKALLEGFNIHISYGRLREVCQTSVDGTSVDTLEEVANLLGLNAQQMMVPIDHLFLPNTQLLPALTIVRLPNGLTHFVIIWRVHGRFVQIMDPSIGRRWLTKKQLLEELYLHTQIVPAETWYEWASSEGFCEPLRQRLTELKIDEAKREQLIQVALATNHWQSLATLDAATRMTATLVRIGGLQTGAEASHALEHFFKSAQPTSTHGNNHIPQPAWLVKASSHDQEQLLFQAAVVIHVSGLKETEQTGEQLEPLSPELAGVLLAKSESSQAHHIWQILKQDGLLTPTVLLITLLLATLGMTIEVLLFKGLLDMGQHLGLMSQRINAVEVLFAFLFIMLLLKGSTEVATTRIGRRLEARLRLAFLAKIPHLGDRYFHSRLTSDMAERAYGLIMINQLPELAINFLRFIFTMVLIAIGIIWLNPASIVLALLAIKIAIGISLITQPLLREQDMRFRTHDAALSRFYLDALLGLIPIRTHGAAKSIRSEQENLLVNWFHAGLALAQVRVLIIAVGSMINTGLAVWIAFNYVGQGGEASGVLVLIYWTLRLPVLGMNIANIAQQYSMLRNRLLRLLEPLNTPKETEMWYDQQTVTDFPHHEVKQTEGVAITWQDVTVQAGGHTILQNISATVTAGEHIAIVGSSGAGKSSLVGLLLGWYQPAQGTVSIDGKLLQGDHLYTIRQETAWVDPSIQIWNRSLRDNLYYGIQDTPAESLTTIIEQADLLDILEKLPEGEQTPLGESGGLVSGGEGQRVRLGRAMLRPNVRLVILDEPFRGLTREKRQALLAKARQYWQKATLIFISHDVGETQTFKRVLVMEKGLIIEDDTPEVLWQAPNSRYHALLAAEQAVRRKMWEGAQWRRWWLEKGQLQEKCD